MSEVIIRGIFTIMGNQEDKIKIQEKLSKKLARLAESIYENKEDNSGTNQLLDEILHLQYILID